MICKRYENSTLENFVCNSPAEKEMIGYLKKCCSTSFDCNVGILGSVGTGKTHIAMAVKKILQDKADYTTIKGIVDTIKRTWAKDADNFDFRMVEKLRKTPLLIIDEVGVQYGSESERIELFDVINSRWNDVLPTLFISNHNRKNIEKILGQRITDRLFGGARIFELTGKSKRGA